jgi:pimeloyl-ACP methyl ester carboxylesterase
MFPADFSHVTGIETMEELAKAELGMNLDEVIKNIVCPILVSHGDQDIIAPAEGAERIVKEAVNSRDARLIMVKGGNHVVNSHMYLYRPQTGDFMLKYLV